MNLSLQLAQNGIAIPESKSRVISLDERTKIPFLPKENYAELCRQLLPLFFKDLGIKGSPTQMDVVRFADMLLEHYKDFSLDEVKYAFELFIVGGLDHLFQDELKHYGEWSIQYMAKILRAYRTVRKNAKNEAYTLLPEKGETIVTEAEKKEIKKNFEVYILGVILEALQTGKFPNYHYTEVVHASLVEMGLCTTEVANDIDIRNAVHRIFSDENRQRSEKKQAREALRGGELSGLVVNMVVNIKVEQSIQKMLKEVTKEQIQEMINQRGQ